MSGVSAQIAMLFLALFFPFFIIIINLPPLPSSYVMPLLQPHLPTSLTPLLPFHLPFHLPCSNTPLARHISNLAICVTQMSEHFPQWGE